MSIRARIGRWLAAYLSAPGDRNLSVATSSASRLAATLRKGDVLLVEGTSRFATAIRYLTQSTWSHAALYIGAAPATTARGGDQHCFVEADVNQGVRIMPLSFYAGLHTRICRPVGLAEGQLDAVVDYAVRRVGHQYDIRNIIDLARYLVQTPPVPTRWRRRMISLGSGDPTRAICSSLIASAFQAVSYPILPEVEYQRSMDSWAGYWEKETFRIRHHSLFAPRDFDISPFFEIVKPTLAHGFAPGSIPWAEAEVAEQAPPTA
ncbi:MAG: YiiX/YebB-like N1pC/P60 family cysteine hydrolase [Gammaproteobacteria bacterium]